MSGHLPFDDRGFRNREPEGDDASFRPGTRDIIAMLLAAMQIVGPILLILIVAVLIGYGLVALLFF